MDDSEERWDYCSNCGKRTPAELLRLHQERCLGVVVCRECYESLNGIAREPLSKKGRGAACSRGGPAASVQ